MLNLVFLLLFLDDGGVLDTRSPFLPIRRRPEYSNQRRSDPYAIDLRAEPLGSEPCSRQTLYPNRIGRLLHHPAHPRTQSYPRPDRFGSLRRSSDLNGGISGSEPAQFPEFFDPTEMFNLRNLR